jgi:hypothetical protein
MKIGLMIVGITLFFIADTYYDGRYSQMIMGWRKYYKIAMIGFAGLSLWTFIRKHPQESGSTFGILSDLVKQMPIDTAAGDILTPIFDFRNFSRPVQSPQMKRMVNSGLNSNKRSVSETKKKYVASQQGWKCAGCSSQLDATFEVDHKLDLQFGGSNHVTNLFAVCRNCHGKKGLLQKIQ